MQNTTHQTHLIYSSRIKVLLLLFTLSGASHIIADEITMAKTVEEDLIHWLSLHRSAEAVEITKEIECLAQNIYFEARSESEQGQLAVGHVVMNRVAHKRYPNSICAVVKQGGEKRRYRCQFSWWCDGRSDQPVNQRAWRRSLELAKTIHAGQSEDPTDGALWYHADYVSPEWSSILVLGKKIGQHLFYLSKKQPVVALNAATGL
ncbi:MAG: cell wall hydrolase [Candidatus Thiodiazotropha sp.]